MKWIFYYALPLIVFALLLAAGLDVVRERPLPVPQVIHYAPPVESGPPIVECPHD